MSRFVPPKPSIDDLARVLRDLQRDIDGIRSGRFQINTDLDMRGNRITGLAKPVDSSDAQTKIGSGEGLFAPIDSSYLVAGSVDPVLPNERLLAGSASIELTDNGPGSTLSISVADGLIVSPRVVYLADVHALPSEPELTSNTVVLLHSGVGILHLGDTTAGRFTLSGTTNQTIAYGIEPEGGDWVYAIYVEA